VTTVEILRAARALIDTPEKWFHAPGDRGHCAAVAIWCTTPARSSMAPGIPAAQEALLAAVGLTGGAEEIYEWNDAPGRSHAEVLAAFDRAIEVAS
jgi:hypothetical protein